MVAGSVPRDGQRRRRVLRAIVIFGITGGIFYLLFRSIDVQAVLSAINQMDPVHFVVAAILTLTFPVMSAIRWRIILRRIGYRVSFSRCLTIIVGIWPISAVSPSKSGDLLKIYSLRVNTDSLAVAGSVIFERVLDVIVLAAFALVGGIFFNNMPIVYISAAVLVLVAAVFVLVNTGLRFPGRAKVRQMLVSLEKVSANRLSLMSVFLLTVANWFGSIVQAKVLFDGVGAHVGLGFTCAGLPVAIFAGLVPVTVAGMGTRDAAMVSLFSSYASNHQILAVAILYSFFAYWLLSIIGLPFMKKALE